MFGIRNAQDSKYTVILYGIYSKLHSDQTIRIKANFGTHKIRNRRIILYLAIVEILLNSSSTQNIVTLQEICRCELK